MGGGGCLSLVDTFLLELRSGKREKEISPTISIKTEETIDEVGRVLCK